MRSERENSEMNVFSVPPGQLTDYETFKNETVRKLKEKLKEGEEIRTGNVLKLNGQKLDSISIAERGQDMCPTIYLNDMYGLYREGMTIEKIAGIIYDTGTSHSGTAGPDVDLPDISDYESVKDNICVKLINTEANAELLKGIPSIRFLDLSVIFYVRFNAEEDHSYQVTVTDQLLEDWGIEKKELLKDSWNNTKRLNPEKCCRTEDLIRELSSRAEGAETPPVCELPKMITLTSSTGNFGAVYMLDREMLGHCSEELQDDILIIPSSIHEVIIIPASMISREDLDRNIREVNRTFVSPAEYLADHAYYYSIETGKVMM